MSRGRLWMVVASMGIAGAAWAQPAKPAKGAALSEREQRLASRRDSKLNEEVAAVYRSADTTYLVGDVSRAAELFQKVLSMAPASNYTVRAMARLGDCSYELKNYDAAAAQYRRATAATEDVTDEAELAAGVRADYMVGQSLLAAKNYTSCFGAFRKFIDRHPAHPLVNVAYQSIGDAHLALEQYQQALTAYRMVGTVVGEKTAAHKRLTPGNRLYLRVNDADVNVGETPRGVKAIVKTSSGDVETVDLEPMGLRNPVFLGTIPTALASPRHSGELDKAFTEQDAAKIRQMLIDAEQMALLARQKQQDAADVERSVEKASNPAGAEKKRTTLMAEAEQLNNKSRQTLDEACKKVDDGFASLEKMVAAWAPEQSVKAIMKSRAAASQPSTQPAAGGDAAADMRAAMAKTITTSDEDELGATTRPTEVARQMSENDVDKVRIDVAAKPTSPENMDTRLTAISVWSRLLKRQFQRLELVGGDTIEIEYVDEIGPKGPQNTLRKDSVSVASDAQVDLLTRDGAERISQVVLGGEVMLRLEDLDRDTSDKADTIKLVVAALPKLDTRAAELKEQTRPASQPTTQRATPGEIGDTGAAGAAKKAPLVPEGAPSLTLTLTETGPHTGVFTRVIKSSATALEVDGKSIPLAAGGQLRAAYEDQKAIRHGDGWVVAKSVECIADAGGEALAVKFGQSYLDLQAKLKRAVAAGEVGKIYLDLGLVKRGKSFLSSAQADCNEVARTAAKSALGEEALYHSWRIYFYAGLLDESVSAARSLMSAYPQSDYIPEAMLAIGQASLALGEKQAEEDKADGKRQAGMNRDLQRAVSQLDELARRYPKSPRAPEALFLVGQAKIAAGQTGLDTFEKLAKQFPDSAFAARGLAKAADYYVSIADFRRAQEYFGRILIDYPDSPDLGDVTLKRGICQYKLGQSAEALASFYKVAEEHPGTELSKQASKFIGFINQNRGATNEK